MPVQSPELTLTVEDRQVLDQIADAGRQTAAEIADVLRWAVRRTVTILNTLRGLGLVVRTVVVKPQGPVSYTNPTAFWSLP